VKYLIIGGKREGEWVELTHRPTGATWVDLMTAETYRVRRITWAVQGPIEGVAAELFKLPILVHPSITGPMEPQFAQMGLMQVIAKPHIDAFMREHAEPQPMAEPDLSAAIPDTPAELTEGGA
jgi:hypothetical protein